MFVSRKVNGLCFANTFIYIARFAQISVLFWTFAFSAEWFEKNQKITAIKTNQLGNFVLGVLVLFIRQFAAVSYCVRFLILDN